MINYNRFITVSGLAGLGAQSSFLLIIPTRFDCPFWLKWPWSKLAVFVWEIRSDLRNHSIYMAVRVGIDVAALLWNTRSMAGLQRPRARATCHKQARLRLGSVGLGWGDSALSRFCKFRVYPLSYKFLASRAAMRLKPRAMWMVGAPTMRTPAWQPNVPGSFGGSSTWRRMTTWPLLLRASKTRREPGAPPLRSMGGGPTWGGDRSAYGSSRNKPPLERRPQPSRGKGVAGATLTRSVSIRTEATSIERLCQEKVTAAEPFIQRGTLRSARAPHSFKWLKGVPSIVLPTPTSIAFGTCRGIASARSRDHDEDRKVLHRRFGLIVLFNGGEKDRAKRIRHHVLGLKMKFAKLLEKREREFQERTFVDLQDECWRRLRFRRLCVDHAFANPCSFNFTVQQWVKLQWTEESSCNLWGHRSRLITLQQYRLAKHFIWHTWTATKAPRTVDYLGETQFILLRLRAMGREIMAIDHGKSTHEHFSSPKFVLHLDANMILKYKLRIASDGQLLRQEMVPFEDFDAAWAADQHDGGFKWIKLTAPHMVPPVKGCAAIAGRGKLDEVLSRTLAETDSLDREQIIYGILMSHGIMKASPSADRNVVEEATSPEREEDEGEVGLED